MKIIISESFFKSEDDEDNFYDKIHKNYFDNLSKKMKLGQPFSGDKSEENVLIIITKWYDSGVIKLTIDKASYKVRSVYASIQSN